MVKRTLTPLPKTVKETVDFIYEFLIVHHDGVQFSAASLGGSTPRRILTILVRRGIVEKTYLLTGKTGRVCKYKWIAPMSPTKSLYGSIVTEIRNEQNAWPSHKKGAKSKKSVSGKEDVLNSASVKTEQKDAVVDASYTGFDLIEYNEENGHFHYSRIKNSFKYGFFIDEGVGSYGWHPIAVIAQEADGAEFSSFLSSLEEKHYMVEEVQKAFQDNISADNLWKVNDRLDLILERLNREKDIFIKKPEVEPTSVFTGFAPLDGFTDQELWDELKRRGYSIEENRLVIVKKTYLD